MPKKIRKSSPPAVLALATDEQFQAAQQILKDQNLVTQKPESFAAQKFKSAPDQDSITSFT